jgi:hypothetical protein
MRIATIATVLSLVFILSHGLIFVVLHFIEPQLNPVSSIISDYAQTSSIWVMKLSLVAFALVWISLSIALEKVSRSPLILVGRALFALAFVSILIGIVFPASMDPRTGSLLSKFQNLLSRPGLFLGILLVSIGLFRQSDWKTQAPWLLGLGIAASVLLVLTIIVLLPLELGGIGQRFVFLVIYLWVCLTGIRLLHL